MRFNNYNHFILKIKQGVDNKQHNYPFMFQRFFFALQNVDNVHDLHLYIHVINVLI